MIALRDVAIAYVRAAFQQTVLKSVVKYRGPITEKTLAQFAVKAPAVVISFEGAEDSKSTGSAVQIPVFFTAAVITKALTDGDSDDPCAAIAEKMTRLLTDQDFGLGWADSIPSVASRNVYTGKLGAMDVNVWILRWVQTINTNKMTAAEFDSLPDLETIHATYEPVEHAPDHQQRTTFDT